MTFMIHNDYDILDGLDGPGPPQTFQWRTPCGLRGCKNWPANKQTNKLSMKNHWECLVWNLYTLGEREG